MSIPIKAKSTYLHNGMTLNYIEKKNSPVTVIITFMAGASLDPRKKEGLAHLTEHLLLQKSKRFPNPNENRLLLEKLGTHTNAFTDTDEMCFYIISGTEDQLYKSLDIFLDMIYKPLLDTPLLEKEKKVILSEINDINSDPIAILRKDIYRKLYFKGSLLERSLFGNMASLKRITLQDIEQYHKDYIINGFSSILVVGDSDFNKLTSYFNDSVSTFSKVTDIPIKLRKNHGNNFINEQCLEVKKFDGSESTSVSVGFKTSSINSKHFYALSLIANALGRDTSGILISKIRESLGLVYDIWVEDRYLLDIGTFDVITSTSKKNVQTVISEILKEFNKLKIIGLNNRVIEDTKLKIINRAPINYETSYSLGMSYYYDYLTNSGITPFNYLDEISKVRNSDIKEAANKFFIKENLRLGMCGNLGSKKIKIDF